MLFLFRGILGVAVTAGAWSATGSCAAGDGVLMRDTEKRPFTVGVCTPGAGDFALEGDGVLDFGDCLAGVAALGVAAFDFGVLFAGVAALGEGVLDFGEAFAGVAAFGVLFAGVAALGEGVLDFGEVFAGVAAFGDFGDLPAGVAALGEGVLDFGDAFPGVAAFGDAVLDLGEFLGLLTGLCSHSYEERWALDELKF